MLGPDQQQEYLVLRYLLARARHASSTRYWQYRMPASRTRTCSRSTSCRQAGPLVEVPGTVVLCQVSGTTSVGARTAGRAICPGGDVRAGMCGQRRAGVDVRAGMCLRGRVGRDVRAGTCDEAPAGFTLRG
jgi:hypothetical protein